jgi:excisionase family DNA binding protein
MTKKELLSDELLTIEEVKVYFKKSLSTINRWIKQGSLKVYGIGGSVYVKASDIKESLKPIN